VHVFEIATFNLENSLALRSRIRKGEVIGPDIYTTGSVRGTGTEHPATCPHEASRVHRSEGGSAFVRRQLDPCGRREVLSVSRH